MISHKGQGERARDSNFWSKRPGKKIDHWNRESSGDERAADLVGLKSSFWQLAEPSNYNKLRVLAQTPFSFLVNQKGNPIQPEDLGITSNDIFCI